MKLDDYQTSKGPISVNYEITKNNNDPNKENKTVYKYAIILTDESNEEIGEFAISGSGSKTSLFDLTHGSPHIDLSIRVEEDYQGLNLANLMSYWLITELEKIIPVIGPLQLFCIDTDASQGFWDKMGLKPSRYENRTLGRSHTEQLPGTGMEKCITFQGLQAYKNNLTGGSYKSKKSKSKKSKSKKSKSKKSKSKKSKSKKSKSKKRRKLNSY
jgi:hypothetical protein